MLQAAPQGGRSNLWGRPETGHLQSLTESPPKYLLMTGVLLTNVQNFLDILSSRRWTLILLFFKCNLNSVTHLLGTEDGKGKREILQRSNMRHARKLSDLSNTSKGRAGIVRYYSKM